MYFTGLRSSWASRGGTGQLCLIIATGLLTINASAQAQEAQTQHQTKTKIQTNYQANAGVWSLKSSVKRVMEVAPEMRYSQAEVAIRKSELTTANAWPNPTIEIIADEKMGIEDGSGGADITEYSVTQAIPLTRLSYQTAVAEANLQATQARAGYSRLELEYRTARRFHNLQLNSEKLKLAQQRLKLATQYQRKPGRKSSQNASLVRFLTPLEKKRLQILRETALQNVAMAEGEYNEARALFSALVNLPDGTPVRVKPLRKTALPAPLAELQSGLRDHALLNQSRNQQLAAQKSIDSARAQRFADPTIKVSRQTDLYSSGKETSTAITFGIQIPLWNGNSGGIAKARARQYQAEARLNAHKRDLQSRLRQSFLHLGNLAEQINRYSQQLLKPAQDVLNLTQRGFRAGELNVLTLIDANNTYFDTKEKHLELLQEAWLELAELRLAAGISLLNTENEVPQ